MEEKQSIVEIYNVAGKGLTNRMLEIMREEALVPWFYQSNEYFDNRKPIDLCREGKSELWRRRSQPAPDCL